MFEFVDTDIDIGEYVNNSIKKEIWLKTRNQLEKNFITSFFEQLEYAAELQKICGQFVQKGALKPIDLPELGAAYIKIQNLKNDHENPFKFWNQIQELFLTTSGEIFLNDEIRRKLFHLIRTWINSLKLCMNLSCNDQCPCLSNWFNRGMKYFDKSYTFDNLLNEETPVMTYFDYIFGTIYRRISEILKEIDNYIPCYSDLFQTNQSNLLDILHKSLKGYQLNFKDGYFYFYVEQQGDRFGSKLINEPIPNLWI